MKKALLLILALICILSLCSCEPKSNDELSDAKPVIYLYPTEETVVSVKLEYDGELTATYPEYNGEWQVVASPDGTLSSLDGEREYYCLFWEGASSDQYDLSRGFVVAGEDNSLLIEQVNLTLGGREKVKGFGNVMLIRLQGKESCGLHGSGVDEPSGNQQGRAAPEGYSAVFCPSSGRKVAL